GGRRTIKNGPTLEELHLLDRAVGVGRGCGEGNVRRGDEARAASGASGDDSRGRVDDDGDGARGRDRTEVIRRAGGEAVRAQGGVGQRDAVGRRGGGADERRAVEEVDLGHGAVGVGCGRGDRDVRRRGKDGVVGWRGDVHTRRGVDAHGHCSRGRGDAQVIGGAGGQDV